MIISESLITFIFRAPILTIFIDMSYRMAYQAMDTRSSGGGYSSSSSVLQPRSSSRSSHAQSQLLDTSAEHCQTQFERSATTTLSSFHH